MSLGPAHALAALLLEDADLRPARFALDDGRDLALATYGAPASTSPPSFSTSSTSPNVTSAPALADRAVDGREAAGRDPHLPAARLNDRVHVGLFESLPKGSSLQPNRHSAQACRESGTTFLAGSRTYFSSTRVPLIFWVLSVLRNLGTMRSISSKYDDSAGVFCCDG